MSESIVRAPVRSPVRGSARIEDSARNIEHVDTTKPHKRTREQDEDVADDVRHQRAKLMHSNKNASAAAAGGGDEEDTPTTTNMSSEIEPVPLLENVHHQHAAKCMMCSYSKRVDILSITPYKSISDTIQSMYDGRNTESVVHAILVFVKTLKQEGRLPKTLDWDRPSIRYHLTFVATTPRSVAASHSRRLDTMLLLMDNSALKVKVKSTGRAQLNVAVAPLAMQLMRHRERLEEKFGGK